MKINIYAILKTVHFTLKNGKKLSQAIELLSRTAQTKQEKKLYTKIYNDLQEGFSFSESLQKNKVGSVDVNNFIAMAEKSVSFNSSLEKILHYVEVKDEFERESNEKTTLPFIYFTLAALIAVGVTFIAIPMQMEKMKGYTQEILDLISDHLYIAQLMSDILFILVLVVASYFILLMVALFGKSRSSQANAKAIGLALPFTSKIIQKFEKFMLFSMIGEMLHSGVSFKQSIHSAVETTTVNSFKTSLKNSLYNIKHNGQLLFDKKLYDDTERELMIGVGTSHQVGSIMLEISSRARADAIQLSGKFFKMITVISIFLMSFAVFIEFYTVVLTQIMIQKGLIDLAKTTQGVN